MQKNMTKFTKFILRLRIINFKTGSSACPIFRASRQILSSNIFEQSLDNFQTSNYTEKNFEIGIWKIFL